MSFNDLGYFVFFPIVFSLYWILKDKYRWVLLLVASYYFYMCWNPKYIFLILGTTLVSYLTALGIEKTQHKTTKKVYLLIATLMSMGVLFVFKYYGFAVDSLSQFLKLFTIELHPVTLKLLLPVGISFYSFQTLSYVIDVYKGKVKAEHHFGYYATFISFFPQLVAGPIERTSNLLPQIKAEKKFSYEQGTHGMRLVLIGLFKKIAIADVLSIYIDKVYSDLTGYAGFTLIIVAVFFSIQIYCDFSGYSDIAIGSAKLLGISLMDNFNSPYFSKNVKEFWARWHISLSTWFRDYVYIPMGGNRVSFIRHKINLLVTFLVSGLWHGANWTFVMWGGAHGIAQMFGKKREKNTEKSFIILGKTILTFCFVTLAWVLFRAQNFHEATYVFGHLFDGIISPLEYCAGGISALDIKLYEWLFILVCIFLIGVLDYISMDKGYNSLYEKIPTVIRWISYFGILLLIVLAMAMFSCETVDTSRFIYFQF